MPERDDLTQDQKSQGLHMGREARAGRGEGGKAQAAPEVSSDENIDH
jgi:hypothetical protein